MSQENLMKFDPATGAARPYPSHASQWREHHGKSAWIYNPWSGEMREARDIGTDPFGRSITMHVVMRTFIDDKNPEGTIK